MAILQRQWTALQMPWRLLPPHQMHRRRLRLQSGKTGTLLMRLQRKRQLRLRNVLSALQMS